MWTFMNALIEEVKEQKNVFLIDGRVHKLD